jgi:YVTN family beta-propeller protein
LRSTRAHLVLTLAAVGTLSCRGDASAPLDHLHQELQGPGLGNLSYAAAEQYTMISPIVTDTAPLGHLSQVAMANGYLVTPYIDGGGFNGNLAVWDVSNPRNAVRVKDYKQPAGTKLREAHAFGFTTGYGGKFYTFAQSNTGFQIWDWTDPMNITLVKDVVLPGADPLKTNYVGVWWLHLQAPYVYAAGTDKGLYVVNASDPLNPVLVKTMTNAQLGITRVNQVHVVGNLMIVNYSENGTGSAILDVSDPANPVLKSSDPLNPPTTYGTMFNGGKFAAAGKTSKKLAMFTIDFDASKNPVGMSRYGVDTGSADLGGGGYVNFQDGFVFVGFANNIVKFDARTLPITQVGKGAPPAPYNLDLDFVIPMGNLVFASNDDGGGGSLMVHQTAPDTVGPSVNFVSPLDGALNRNVKSRVGLTFTDNVDLNSINTSTIIVRPVGGSALAGKYSSQAGMVNFFPDAPLAANTTYEVIVPAGGVRDDVGNTVPTPFTSSFSTGSTLGGGPGGCSIGTDTPGLVGGAIAFTATGCTGSGLTYSWQFGDGSAPGTGASTSHSYAEPSHYSVILTVTDGSGVPLTVSRRQTVTYPATASKPTRTSTVVVDTTRARISVVNSDASTVASLDTAAPFTKRWEMPVGKNPRTLAQPAPGGALWVANQDDASISVLDGGTGLVTATIALPPASRPFGVVFNPAGTLAYVTLEGTGRLLRIDAATRAITGDLDVGPSPRGVAVSSDGARLLVTRLVSPDSGGEVREVSAASFTVVRTFALPEDTTTPSTESDGPGLPNYVQAVTISPDGRGAWVPSKKDNLRRGTGPGSTGEPFTHDSRVRTIVSKLDLVANTTDLVNRRDIDNADLANAVAFNDLGDWAFVCTQGGNRIEVYDALSHGAIASIDNTGLAPRGLVFSAGKLYVQNFMSRDLAIYDVSAVGGTNVFTKLATVSTQLTEALPAQVLQGKKIFYNAADPRMSRDAYTSCASCHLDGDNDGRRWDFTQFGEGVRATTSLLGRGGMGQGPVHWTGNFDEIQDFENDMRGPAFGGTGFLSAADFAATSDTLGTPKAGRSAELDALAAYLGSLTVVPPSPYRNPDGSLTADALAGKALFESPAVGCATCHGGAEKTDSALNLFHDVGTLTAASGQRRGQPLTGLDTPSLLGVWMTAPYLHDSSAATLLDVITTRNPANQHGTTSQLTATEKAQLVAYLQQLDDGAPAPAWSGQDVGAVGVAGGFSEGGGAITVSGAGADITGTADAFYFVSRDLSGDGSISARVANVSGGDGVNVKAGVMMRDPGADGLGANDVNAFTMVKPAFTQNKFQRRLTSGGSTTSIVATTATPTWVRLTRTGNTLLGEQSVDGSVWTTIGSDTVTMTTVKVGFAVTSHTTATTATAIFTNVVFTQSAVANPTLSVGTGTYSNAQSVSISAASGASIRYTLDGSQPSPTSGTVYSTPLPVATSGTVLRAIAYKTGMAPSAVISAVYTLTAAAPTPSPAGGSYAGAQNVTLTSTTTGATMYYTLDGSTPSTGSTLYAGAINIATTKTLKAIAVKAGMGQSNVTSASYTIGSATPVTVNPSADAYVRDGTSAANNYGTAATLEVKNSNVNYTRVAYVRFPIGALVSSVSNAKLRLYGAAVASAKAISVYSVASTTWGESTITWNNAPASGTAKLATVTVSLTAQYWEWDVTAYLQAEKALGHTDVSFALKADVYTGESQTTFNPREASANKPQLVVTP